MYTGECFVLIVDPDLHAKTGDEQATRKIVASIEEHHLQVLESFNCSDAIQTFLKHPEISCVLIEWEVTEKFEGETLTSSFLVNEIRKRNTEIPIFILTSKHNLEEIPPDLIEKVQGYLWKMEDTPNFIAKRIENSIEEYVNTLLPPFFKELAAYVSECKYAWHTPGHSGGMAFLKSPVGRQFYSFLGENVFRSDLSLSVPELGSLQEHGGVIGKAEAQAAKIFHAEQTYFVTNGTSTANKMVASFCLSRGDIVLVDRNCHQSLLHAMILTGAIPIYLQPTRNAYGIIGGIDPSEFAIENIRKKIEESPLIKDKNAPIKLVVITNSTYDGLIYDVEKIKHKLRGHIEALHLDEAWFAYANFHPIYENRYGMSQELDHTEDPTIFTTHSTHKVLAAFSQASMIHIREGKKPVPPHLFNESFIMYTSTSPEYSMIASLDVAAKMMEGVGGKFLMQETLDEAIVFRKKMVEIQESLDAQTPPSEKKWWFSIWQPQAVREELANEKEYEHPIHPLLHPSSLSQNQEAWQLRAKDRWHGFPKVEDGFMMLDPLKVTFLTPGIDIDGTMHDEGIPAPIVAKYLMSKGVVDEKTGFYNFLALFCIGITKGKASISLAALIEFRKLFNQNQALDEVFPQLTTAHPHAYQQMTLQDLAQKMHLFLKQVHITKLMTEVFSVLPEQVLAPWEAYQELIHGEVEEVPIAELMGRVPAVMIVPYPPGIPLIMPGERITQKTKGIITYLQVLEQFNTEFPGFETDTHGLTLHEEGNKKQYCVYCLKNR